MANMRVFLIIMVVFLLALNFSQSEATIMKVLSLEELSEKADIIAQCKVKSIHSEWNTERSMIFTYVELIPTNYFKNQIEDSSSVVILKLIEGRVGDIETVVLGNPTFQLDEETILYLKQGQGESFNGFLQIVH